MADGGGGRGSTPSRVVDPPAAPSASSAAVVPSDGEEEEDGGSPPPSPSLRRLLDYVEDVVDGFAIASFSTAEELESFVKSQRSQLTTSAQFDNSTPTLEDSDDGSVGVGVSYAMSAKVSELSASSFPVVETDKSPPPTPLETSDPNRTLSPDHATSQTDLSAVASPTVATCRSLTPPTSTPTSSAGFPPSRQCATDATASPPPQRRGSFPDIGPSVLAPSTNGLPDVSSSSSSSPSSLSVDRLSLDLACSNKKRKHSDVEEFRGGDAVSATTPSRIPPSKRALQAVGQGGSITPTAPDYPSAAAKFLKTPERCSPKSLSESESSRGRIHSERIRISGSRDKPSCPELCRTSPCVKLSPSLANAELKNREFKKGEVQNRCCHNSATKNSTRLDAAIRLPATGFPQPLGQKPSLPSSREVSSPQNSQQRPEVVGRVGQSPFLGISSLESSTSPLTSQTRRGCVVSRHVTSSTSSSSSLPEVVVREHPGQQRSASNNSNVRRMSDIRTPVSSGLSNSSASSNNFPFFPPLDKDSSVFTGHPLHFPAAHPAPFASDFSASSLPFGLPPFQHSGMLAPSLGFPHPSTLMTSPLVGLSNHFHPETMLSLSTVPGQDLLTRLQQELNARFLQDRGLLPIAPFTLHAEMHQHQHLHHHQHLLPGSYLPPPPLGRDPLSMGTLPPVMGGLLQSSQNLSEFIERDHLTKASFSGFGSMSAVGSLPPPPLPPPPPPFYSALNGAFQPKSGLSSLNLSTASHLLLSLCDRDPFSSTNNQLPHVMKKPGQWCAAHVQTAWKIYRLKRHLVDGGCGGDDDDDNEKRSCPKLLRRDSHLHLPPPGCSRLSLVGDGVRPNTIADPGLPPFGRESNFIGCSGLNFPFARKHAYDAASSPSILRPPEWSLLPPPPAPTPQQPPSSLLVPGSWLKSVCTGSRESSGSLERLERLNDPKEKPLNSNRKLDNVIIGKEFHKNSDVFHSSSSHPPSIGNSVNGDHKQSVSGLAYKGNGHFRSRSRSPLKFPSSRSSAPINCHSKEPRSDKIFGKSNIQADNFPIVRSHDYSGTSNHSGLRSTECIGSCCCKTETGCYRFDTFRPPANNREPASSDVPARDHLATDPVLFAELGCRCDVAVQPPLHAKEFYAADVYKPFASRPLPHCSPLPSVGLPSPLVGSSYSPPLPISAAKNNRVVRHNGWSNCITSSAGLVDIPSDGGLVLW